MLKFWFIIYNALLLPIFWVAFMALSLFNPKIREGFSERKKIFGIIKTWEYNFPFYPRVLIHSSSLGEYQQSVPLIEELHGRKINVISSFFSPSGYRNSKLPFSDVKKTYLPFDTLKNVCRFLDILNPSLIILIRYDLWFNLLYQAKKRKIPVIIANARYDENDFWWKIPFVRSFKKTMYGMIGRMFAIDESDRKNYSELMKGTDTEVVKAGDSKFERVFEASKNAKPDELPGYKLFKNKKVFVIGSSWKEDEAIILPVVNKIVKYEKDLLTVLVPHEPKLTKIKAIEKNIITEYSNLKTIRYSCIDDYNNENLIIVDSIGKLMNLYSVAYVSYVGGGMHSGLHNVLEPAIFNMPVFFSNKVKNSDEDEILLAKECGILVNDKYKFYRDLRKILSDVNYRSKFAKNCRLVFDEQLGTTKKIIQYILKDIECSTEKNL